MLLLSGSYESFHVCLLNGIRLPLVLRRDKDGYYHVTITSYVHQPSYWDVCESRANWEGRQLITLP